MWTFQFSKSSKRGQVPVHNIFQASAMPHLWMVQQPKQLMWSSTDSRSRKRNLSLDGRNGEIALHQGIYTGREEFVAGFLDWGLLVCLVFFSTYLQSYFCLGQNFLQIYIVATVRMCLEDLQSQEHNWSQIPAAVLWNPLLYLQWGHVPMTGCGRDIKTGSLVSYDSWFWLLGSPRVP